METGSPRAVFISYARDDIAAAQRAAEALRSNGVEVWFDLNELRGGDAWDQKIRKQIKACTLFLPVISARTQERSEGYFRLEWKLAVERTHLMAEGVPFLVPLVLDDTSDSGALVPTEFLRVQWMRLQGGLPSQQFVEHVKSLLEEPGRPSVAVRNSPQLSGPDEKSIAILAFANLSRDPENEFFSDGISEELLNLVARIPGLNVAARTSAFYFKGKNVPISEIASTLRVAHVVEGSVRKVGTRVRITAQLINAANGFQIWSETFDRELRDIFAVQDEIAGLIAESLQLKLGGAVRVAQTVNPEAHRLVLEGRHFWALRTPDGFDKAERAFSKALAIDSDFAPAHTGLADVWGVRAWYASASGVLSYKENLMKASHEAELALKLDSSSGEANAALGVVYYHLHRWAEAERHFVQTFRLNPNYAIAHQWHAHLLAAL
jgi:TolB-like protein